jgi:hypothetical protein
LGDFPPLAGQWQAWELAGVDGYTLKVGQTFLGEAHRQPDGKWKATLNGKPLGWFGVRDDAFERVEQEITMLMRLAMADLTNFRPKRPEPWAGDRRS